MKIITKKTGMKYLWGVLVFVILAGGVYGACSQKLKLQYYTEGTSKVTEPVRLAVLTDLHSTLYGRGQEELVQMLSLQKPDAVLLVGDIADHKVSHQGTQMLLAAIGYEYPCFYVSGNHEYWSGEVEAIKQMIDSYGVTILEGEKETLEVKGQKIQICGVDDPSGFAVYASSDGQKGGWERQFQDCQDSLEKEQYSVLMSHRPELTDFYTDSDFDLVVAGHAHGGQVRIPWLLNGLFAPGQGLFPSYAGGQYALGQTSMIVSRGLCRNKLPRIFNRPELVVVDVLPEIKEQQEVFHVY